MMRRLVSETFIVIATAAILAVGSYALRPDALPLIASSPSVSPGAGDELFKAIPFEQAQQMFVENRALFADARPLIAYEAGHIAGAVHLDPNAFDQWANALLAGTAPDQTIIAYCEGPQCALSHELAEKLTWLGFEQVYYLVDGWGQWKAHGLPTETSRSGL
jgi:rhodanese-related sulfurtransferase